MSARPWRKVPERQQRAIEYLASAQNAYGRIPSYRAVAAHFGYASLNAVAELFDALARRGWIHRHEGLYVVSELGFNQARTASDAVRRRLQADLFDSFSI